MTAQEPARRETVTGTPRGTARTPRRAAGAPPGVDEERLRRLIHAQGRAALTAALVLAVLFGSLPLVFALAPALAATRVLGVGVAWVLLGVLAGPLLYGIGRWYVARAEAHEAAFTADPDGAGQGVAGR